MKKNAFFIYLSTEYRGVRSRKPLSNKAISDICSRCEKLEKDFGIELDKDLAGVGDKLQLVYEKLEKRFPKRKGSRIYDMKTSANRYFDFLKYEKRISAK